MGPNDVKEWAQLLGLAPGVVVVGYFVVRGAADLAKQGIAALVAISAALREIATSLHRPG